MNQILKGLCLSLVFTLTLAYAGKDGDFYKNVKTPGITEATFEDASFIQQKKTWFKQKRKLASSVTYKNSDLSPDFKKLRDEWLKVESGNEMELLLKKSYSDYNSYSEDTRYFLSQFHTALPLRGIIWRLRPLFENSKGFLGNKSTHVTAVQAVRATVSALKMILPTQQTDAVLQYFTEPSTEMGKNDQFQSVSHFQDFMLRSYIPILNESISRIQNITRENAQKIFVWDNKMVFGTGTFDDDIKRFVGHGPAEMNFTLAIMYRAYHNVLLYCAYNQDYSIKLAGEIGSHLGIDASLLASRREDLGLTDKERVSLIRSATRKHRFLELRNYEGSDFGNRLMKQAYSALKNSVIYAERAYEYLQGQDSSQSMTLNPILFQTDMSPHLDKGISNMKAVVSGPAEVRDPVSGQTVTLNLPAFYKEPPQSLSILMATNFEGGEIQKTIRNKKGESLVVRNYLHGRSVAWDNNAWKKFIPSAEGKSPSYMAEARRMIRYSFGTSMVFGLPDLFVH